MLKIAWWVFIYGSFPIKFLTFNSLGPRTCKTVICIPFHHRQRCEDNFRFWFPRRVYESALRILRCNHSCFTWWKVPSRAEWLVGQSLCLVVVTRLIINVGSPKNAFLALKLCVVSLYMPFNVIYHICLPFIGMTIDPAYSSFTEDILGSIEAGKRADFTIFSRDIMTIPVDSILNTQVVATVIDGKTVYGTLDCDV